MLWLAGRPQSRFRRPLRLQMDKFQTPCIDNQEPDVSAEELAQTYFHARMCVSYCACMHACARECVAFQVTQPAFGVGLS